MHILLTLLCWVILGAFSWRFPKAFAYVVLGPLLGAPVGLVLWTVAIQFLPVFTLPCALAFSGTFTLVVGWLFAQTV